MSKLKTLEDLFQHEIKDLYSAENQLLDAIPKMENAATTQELKKTFSDHHEETKEHKERLKKIGKIHGFSVDGEKCEAAKGLIKEGEGMIDENAENDVKDAGLIAVAQRIEHYEIAAYGSACQFADRLGYGEALELLKETLKQEKNADKKLSQVAKNTVNKQAVK